MDINNLIKSAVKEQDFTKESKGGSFKKELPEAGIGVCRLREYVELGTHDKSSKAYPNKKPQPQARFVFELCTPKHIREFEVDGTTIRRPHVLTVQCAISASGMSNYIKLFKKLNWKGDITHPAQALGRPFLCEVTHAWASDDDKAVDEPKYANLIKDKEFMLSPPRNVDPLAGTTSEIIVPELLEPIKIFLWNNPTQETWDALFIDGTHTRDDKKVSNNWIQELIVSAIDYEGSLLYTLREGGLDLGATINPDDEIPF